MKVNRSFKKTSSGAIFAFLVLIYALISLGIIESMQKERMKLVSRIGLEFGSSALPAKDESQAQEDNEDKIVFHPFENKCKFPISNIYPVDISHYQVAERLRTLQCPYDHYDFATMDSEGYMYVHPHFTNYPNKTTNVTCKVVFVEGALRNNRTNRGKDEFREVAVVEAPQNKRFLANGDAFYIRCYVNGKKAFEQVYPGMRDLNKERHKVYLVKDMPSFDDYGRRLRRRPQQKPVQRYSIDILGFDSTSRTMFMRHLPRSIETMNRLGYELFYGYNKVGDNSEINIVPILAGDLPEALGRPRLNKFHDINTNWILPKRHNLDPNKLPFLWKMMRDEFGCRSMLNEDISKKMFGLFHYPPKDFLPGFTAPPADHFYRAYYLAVYKNWLYTQCKDGNQVQRRYVDLWRRFSNKYKDECHFGFTFMSTLSHEEGFVLEVLDEQVSSSLENLYFTGALDRGVSVIMGDHGNRIGLVQYSYNGRIEERMPLMAIRLPPDFKKIYPKEYANFLNNKWKLTSNFDIHQTLKDFALMSFGSARRHATRSYGRGISLFDEIPANRTCPDAYIPENFCTCMINRAHTSTRKRKIGEVEKKLVESIQVWIENDSELTECFDEENITIIGNASVLGLNAFARYGVRRKGTFRHVKRILRMPPNMNYLHHEVTVRMETSKRRGMIRLLFRIEEAVRDNVFRVVLEPLVRYAPQKCYAKSVFSVCRCLVNQATNT